MVCGLREPNDSSCLRSLIGGCYKGKTNQREVLFDKGLKVKLEKVEFEGYKYVFYITEI